MIVYNDSIYQVAKVMKKDDYPNNPSSMSRAQKKIDILFMFQVQI
jgi:hypothetical protein